MACLRPEKSVSGSRDNLHEPRSIIQIYTSWANHYLEKGKSKRRVSDLTRDVLDGIVLIDVIEALSGQKIPNVHRKPKTPSQMVDNINACLSFLINLGVSLDETICTLSIREGHLKTILGLFFALSRYKQQQKLQHEQQRNPSESHTAALPEKKEMATKMSLSKPGTAIPVSSAVPKKSGLPSKSGVPAPVVLSAANTNNNIGNSPGGSMIPTPRSHRNSASSSSRPASTASSTDFSKPTSHISSLRQPEDSSHTGPSLPIASNADASSRTPTYDKLRFSKPSDKPKVPLSPRASSSSGFSSAKSDSSTSACGDTRIPSSEDTPRSSAKMPESSMVTLAVFDQPVAHAPSGGSHSHHLPSSAASSARNSPKTKAKLAKLKPPSEANHHHLPAVSSSASSPAPGAARDRDRDNPSVPSSTSKSTSKMKTHSPKVKPRSALTGTSSLTTASSSCKSSPKLKPKEIAPPTSSTTASGSSSASTGIPKPTAAVKGTAKVVKPNTVTSKVATPSNPPSSCSSPTPVATELGTGTGTTPTASTSSVLKPKLLSPRLKTNPSTNQPMAMVFPMPISTPPTATPESGIGEESEPRLDLGEDDDEGARRRDHSERTKETEAPVEEDRRDPPRKVDTEDDMAVNVPPMSPLLKTQNWGLRGMHPSYRTLGGDSGKSSAGSDVGLDGYMSEGGASVYARRLHNLAQLRGLRDDESVDDSSSLSSGISDPWGMELPGSGLYGGHQYRQISSSQWKKYAEGGKFPPDVESLRTQRCRSESRDSSSDGRKLERAKMNGSALEKKKGTREETNGVQLMESRLASASKGQSSIGAFRERNTSSPAPVVPSSFGYVSRPSLDSRRPDAERSKTAQVTTVPRIDATKSEISHEVHRSLERPKAKIVKVSGGTQTTNDLGSGSGSSPATLSSPRVTTSSSSSSLPNTHSPSNSRRKVLKPSASEEQRYPGSGASSPMKYQHHMSSSSLKALSLTAPTAQQMAQNYRERFAHHSQSLPKQFPTGSSLKSTGSSSSGDTEYVGTFKSTKSEEWTDLAHFKPTNYQTALEYGPKPSTGGGQAAFAAHLFAGVSDFSVPMDTDLSEEEKSTRMNSNGSSSSYYPQHHKMLKEKLLKLSGRLSSDGSLSDTPYANYAELMSGSKYGNWIRHSSSYAAQRNAQELLSDSEVITANKNLLSRDFYMTNPPSPRLNRSNSVRSEKVYPSMLQRTENGNGSPSPNVAVPDITLDGPLNQTGTGGCRSSLGHLGSLLSRLGSRDDECHGSSLSLVSTASSSIYSTQEEKQAAEIRRLRRDLAEAQEKVNTLSGQLSTNAHVVVAFEQSLASMTQRLQTLTASAEQKESDLVDLRKQLEELRSSSHHMARTSSSSSTSNLKNPSATTGSPPSTMARHLSSDSVCSVTSHSSSTSFTSPSQSQTAANPPPSPSPSLKKKNWLRSSFSKAFGGKNKKKDGEEGGYCSAPASPLMPARQQHLMAHNDQHPTAHPDKTQSEGECTSVDSASSEPEVVEELKQQLRQKDMVLTDIRLEALSSAHQLEALRETVNRMREELVALQQDNARLQQQLARQRSLSLASSQASLGPPAEIGVESSSPSWERLMGDTSDKDAKIVPVKLHCQHEMMDNELPLSVLIGYVSISGKTKWEKLDESLRQLFQEYLTHVDVTTSLGIDITSVASFRLGEIERQVDASPSDAPELLPVGYLVGDVTEVELRLGDDDVLDPVTWYSLTPKHFLKNALNMLKNQKKLLLVGPSGGGKSYLAKKLAKAFLWRNADKTGDQIKLKVESKSCKDLRYQLFRIEGPLTTVEVALLDDLQSQSPKLVQTLIQSFGQQTYVVGVMAAPHVSPVVQSFQELFPLVHLLWHQEPLLGFLGRYLRRKMMHEVLTRKGDVGKDMKRIVEWMGQVWQHCNQYLEKHGAEDSVIGPRLFLSCPMDAVGSQVWFTGLWNYTLLPYLLNAIRDKERDQGAEGSEEDRNRRREDPANFLIDTYPWSQRGVTEGVRALARLRPEENHSGSDTRSGTENQNTDPMLNMLMRLQQASLPLNEVGPALDDSH